MIDIAGSVVPPSKIKICPCIIATQEQGGAVSLVNFKTDGKGTCLLPNCQTNPVSMCFTATLKDIASTSIPAKLQIVKHIETR